MVQFKRIWNPNLSVHVKLAKLASIPPRWDKLTPTQSKSSLMEVWIWLRCVGAIMTPWNICV